MLARVEGLSEYDMRRPMTPTGTNLLGTGQASRGVEYRLSSATRSAGPRPTPCPWNEDGTVWEGADMWAKADESSDYILGLYRTGGAHSDATIELLDLDTPGSVPHWP